MSVVVGASSIPAYNTTLLREALGMFLEAGRAAPALVDQSTFQYDLVTLAAQVASNMALELHNASMVAYNASFDAADKAPFIAVVQQNAKSFLDLMYHVDTIVGTQVSFCRVTFFK
jgi:hypothetical protein